MDSQSLVGGLSPQDMLEDPRIAAALAIGAIAAITAAGALLCAKPGAQDDTPSPAAPARPSSKKGGKEGSSKKPSKKGPRASPPSSAAGGSAGPEKLPATANKPAEGKVTTAQAGGVSVGGAKKKSKGKKGKGGGSGGAAAGSSTSEAEMRSERKVEEISPPEVAPAGDKPSGADVEVAAAPSAPAAGGGKKKKNKSGTKPAPPPLEDGWEAVTVGKKKKNKQARAPPRDSPSATVPGQQAGSSSTTSSSATPAVAASSSSSSSAAAAAAPAGAGSSASSSSSTVPPSTAAHESIGSVPTGNLVKVAVDPRKIGVIIGPKGSTLHKLEEVTGCRIQVHDRDSSDPSNKPIPITITGPAEGLASAQQSVMELASKGYAMALAAPDFVESFIIVHPVYYSELIGSRGASINAIKDALGVQMNFPKSPRDVSQAKPGKVTLAGPKAAISKCKEVVQEIMQHYHSAVTHPGFVHAEFEVPEYLMARFCGTKRANIRHIEGDSRARVYLPRQHFQNPKVVVVGHPAQVEVAQKHITRILQTLKQEDEQDGYAGGDHGGDEDDEGPEEEWMKEYLYRRSR